LDASLRSIDRDGDWDRCRIANLSGGKAFNNAHCPLTLRTFLRTLLVGSAGLRFGRFGQKAAKLKQVLTFSIGQAPEVSNAWKAFRQDMLQKSAKEFFAAEGHRAFLAVIGIILPPEPDFGFGDREKTMIGDGNAMGVAGQIVQNMVWPAKGWFRIHDPIVLKHGSEKSPEVLFIR